MADERFIHIGHFSKLQYFVQAKASGYFPLYEGLFIIQIKSTQNHHFLLDPDSRLVPTKKLCTGGQRSDSDQRALAHHWGRTLSHLRRGERAGQRKGFYHSSINGFHN